MTTIYANSQKTKPPYFDQSDFHIFAPIEETGINKNVAATLFSISKEGKLPSWVLGLSPIEELKKTTGGIITKPRMWMVRGMALICPRLDDGVLSVKMVVIDDDAPVGLTNFIDIDSGNVHQILIPSSFEESCLFDVCWEQESNAVNEPDYL